MKNKIKNNGLTLMELLIVIAIVAMMTSMIFMATRGSWIDANKRQTAGTIAIIEGALDEYRDYEGSFPNRYLAVDFNSTGLSYPAQLNRSASLYSLLTSIPDSKKALERIADNQIFMVTVAGKNYFVFIDAWKQVIDYRFMAGINTYPLIVSAGPDKIFNTADDMTNRK